MTKTLLAFALGLTMQMAHAAPNSVTCAKPDDSFSSFLARFSTDRAFQDSRIIYPLVVKSGQPAQAPMDVQLWGEGAVTDFKRPVFMSPQERKRLGLEQKLTLATPKYAEVYVHKPDADSHEETYTFRKHGNCWYLETLLMLGL